MNLLNNLYFSCNAPPACHGAGTLAPGFNCMANHPHHTDRLIECHAGEMRFPLRVFEWEIYEGTGNYCPGHEESHHALLVHGTWEREETQRVMDVLRNGDRNQVVLDFGANIGWFSIIAARMGYQVAAFEAEGENCRLLRVNAMENGVRDKVDVIHTWVGADTPELNGSECVALLKVDMEGHDKYAIRACRWLLKNRMVQNAMVEFSPVFGPDYTEGYTALAHLIMGYGYSCETIEGQQLSDAEIPPFMQSIQQTNLWFKRI